MSDERLALVVRHRHVVRVAIVSLALAAGLAIPNLEVRFAPEELVAPDDDAARASHEMRRAFGADEEALVVLVEAEDVLAPAPFGWSHALARFLAAQPAVARVESLGTTPLPRVASDIDRTLEDLDAETELEREARERAEDALRAAVASDRARFPQGLVSLAERARGPIMIEPLVAGDAPTELERAAIARAAESTLVRRRLLDEDHHVLAVAAILREGASDDDADALVGLASARIAEHAPPEGVRARLGGLPTMRVTMVRALREDQVLLVSLAALGSFLVLTLGMRTVAGVVLPLGTVGITLAISMGGMAIAGEPINLLTNVIPPLLVTIGLAEALHMVLRYREEHRASAGDRLRAASRTLRAMWLPCFVTTFTTAIGFGALVLQETAILRRFGVIAAIATMISYLVTVLFVPASLPDFDAASRGDAARRRALRGLDSAIVTLARATARRPWWTIAISAALFLGSLVIARGVVVDSALLDQFDRRSEIAEITHLAETELDGVRQLSIGLRAEQGRFGSPRGIAELDQLASWLRGQPGVLRATTGADWLHESWALLTGDESARTEPMRSDQQVRALRSLVASGGIDPLARYVTPDGAQARIEVRLADRGASRILSMLDRFADRAAAIEGVEVRFSGEAWDASRGLDRIVRSLGSLASAVVMIFVVMLLLFRSVRLGLLSIPPNALPLAITLAYMALRGIPLHAATVIVFTVTIGLAVDGATHVIARFREELARGASTEETLLRAMETSGRGVVLSGVTLLLGYAALLFSAFEPVRLFGELSAVAIGGSLVAQLALLPALLAVGARRSDGAHPR